VAYEYNQVPGLNFHASFSPVVNDVIIQILLAVTLVWNVKAKIVDAETTFLMGT
jgi:hypothetical protein